MKPQLKANDLMDVEQWLIDQDVDERTISFYCNADGDSPDSNFGRCDISGLKGSVAYCMALTNTGEVLEFSAGEWLVGGVLGRIAGAF